MGIRGEKSGCLGCEGSEETIKSCNKVARLCRAPLDWPIARGSTPESSDGIPPQSLTCHCCSVVVTVVSVVGWSLPPPPRARRVSPGGWPKGSRRHPPSVSRRPPLERCAAPTGRKEGKRFLGVALLLLLLLGGGGGGKGVLLGDVCGAPLWWSLCGAVSLALVSMQKSEWVLSRWVLEEGVAKTPPQPGHR